MFRLGNLSKHRTGLSVVVWIEANMGMKHVSPRMLFSNSTGSCLRPGDSADSLIPVSLDPENPKVLLDDAVLNISTLELEAIKRWIVKNYRRADESDDGRRRYRNERFPGDDGQYLHPGVV